MTNKAVVFFVGAALVALVGCSGNTHNQTIQEDPLAIEHRLHLEEVQQMTETVQQYLEGSISEEELASAQPLLDRHPEMAATVERKQALKDPSLPKLSREDHERMATIIQKVNEGELPESALQEAQPLIERNPEYVHTERNQ